MNLIQGWHDHKWIIIRWHLLWFCRFVFFSNSLPLRPAALPRTNVALQTPNYDLRLLNLTMIKTASMYIFFRLLTYFNHIYTTSLRYLILQFFTNSVKCRCKQDKNKTSLSQVLCMSICTVLPATSLLQFFLSIIKNLPTYFFLHGLRRWCVESMCALSGFSPFLDKSLPNEMGMGFISDSVDISGQSSNKGVGRI